MPLACIRAYAVVGPTNLKPRFFRSLAIAFDSSVCDTSSSPGVRSRGVSGCCCALEAGLGAFASSVRWEVTTNE